MDESPWTEIQSVFHDALERPPGEREAFVRQRSGSNRRLRDEVMDLLSAHGDDSAANSAILPDQKANGDTQVQPDWRGRSIDRYVLGDCIGEGGMGMVYEGQQTEPIKRKVAIKLIKPGLDSRQIVARFEVERRTLAAMNHPNIAQAYDAGQCDDGRPFFAMEYVDGAPITRFCDERRLDLSARLGLFVQVCDGVQHAHWRGCTHRDLKPGNVLVTQQDGVDIPKIIDFGVVKAVDEPMESPSLATHMGMIIGTPAYMSPEQAEGRSMSVDARTDVYSLGAILYELLVGVPPFDASVFGEQGFAEVIRTIRETEPLLPSQRLVTLSNPSTKQRADWPANLEERRASLRGDLDAIVMKCLEKEKARRYSSPQEIAQDIQRFQSGKAVNARKQTKWYLTQKFVRRNAAAVAIGTVAVVALSTFSIVTSFQNSRIASERDRAELERDASRSVSDFLTSIFRAADARESGSNNITASDLLAQAQRRINVELSGQPELQGRLMRVIGRVYQGLGEFPTAEPLLRDALAIHREKLGDGHVETLQSMRRIGSLLYEQEKLDEAETLLLETVAIDTEILGATHRETLEASHHLALVYTKQGRLSEAQDLIQRELDTLRSDKNPDKERMFVCLNDLSLLATLQGNAEAETFGKEAIDLGLSIYGRTHPKTLIALDTLAQFYFANERYEEAEPLFRQQYEGHQLLLGDDRKQTVSAARNLGLVYAKLDRLEEAHELLSMELKWVKNRYGADNSRVSVPMFNMAALLCRMGAQEECLLMFEDSINTGLLPGLPGKQLVQIIMAESDLAPVHDHPRFKAGLDTIRARD